jgi:hypothetical protein
MVRPPTIFLFAGSAILEKADVPKTPESYPAFLIPKTLPITAKTTCNS